MTIFPKAEYAYTRWQQTGVASRQTRTSTTHLTVAQLRVRLFIPSTYRFLDPHSVNLPKALDIGRALPCLFSSWDAPKGYQTDFFYHTYVGWFARLLSEANLLGRKHVPLSGVGTLELAPYMPNYPDPSSHCRIHNSLTLTYSNVSIYALLLAFSNGETGY